jgi:hypothetical protein
MSWLITGAQPFPAVIGEEFGGGFFAGYISHTADGNPTHALIVAPAATGATGTGYTLTANLAWKTAATTTVGTTSDFDGTANTAAMVTAGIADHPAAQFCVGLNIGGFTDWYLPARYELEIAYFNLKPGTTANVTNAGANVYAVPSRGSNYTTGNPARTYVSDFVDGGGQPFVATDLNTGRHWTSTEISTSAWHITFLSGAQGTNAGKTGVLRVRAFRRIAL